MANQELFTDILRKSTKKVHKLSDLLVGVKFAYAIADDAVLAECLLVFYDIFKFLENVSNVSQNKHINVFKFGDELMLTERFETDLKHYFGNNWKDNYEPRECVVTYLQHLQHLEKTDPEGLIMYIYHLYLGFFSGGQLVRRRMQSYYYPVFRCLNSQLYTNAVFDFNRHVVRRLKNDIKGRMNDVAAHVSAETKQKWLKESVLVFTLNMQLIQSVKSSKDLLMRKLTIFGFCFFFILLFILAIYFGI